jgi:hypothetical protein
MIDFRTLGSRAFGFCRAEFRDIDVRSADRIAKLAGIIFVALAIIGFVPNPLLSAHGFFLANTADNVFHALLGIALLTSGMINRPKAMLIAVGIVVFLTGMLGYMTVGDFLFGTLRVNIADHYLNMLLGIALVIIGIRSRRMA